MTDVRPILDKIAVQADDLNNVSEILDSDEKLTIKVFSSFIESVHDMLSSEV